jgi:microcystin-dependent protein
MQVRVETLADLKRIKFNPFDTVFCVETEKEYFLNLSGGSLTPDDDDIVQAIHGANARYVAMVAKVIGGTPGSPAILDESGKIPLANMPASVFTYKGGWNAATNTPELADGVGTSGNTYRVTHAGSVNFGAGAISFAVGDKAVYNGTVWEKWDVQDQEVPVGTYIQHGGASAPTGYLACNGAAVSRATYAALFGVLSTTYGAGDGSTTFNLPDARGLVMVGAGAHGTMTRANGTAYNGGSVGASRNDQMQGHRHASGITGAGGGSVANSAGLALTDTGLPVTDAVNGTPRTGDETRPAEIAVLVCIKF